MLHALLHNAHIITKCCNRYYKMRRCYKMPQNSVEQYSELCKCLKTWEDLSDYKCSWMQVDKCWVGSFHKCNKLYNLHRKIYTQCAYGAYQEKDLTFKGKQDCFDVNRFPKLTDKFAHPMLRYTWERANARDLKIKLPWFLWLDTCCGLCTVSFYHLGNIGVD